MLIFFVTNSIQRQQPRKTLAKDWFPNGFPTTVNGKIEFYQQSEYDLTNIDVSLKGLNYIYEYTIHPVTYISYLIL